MAELVFYTEPRDDGRLFNPDLFVDAHDPYQRALYLVAAFLITYDNDNTIRGLKTDLSEWVQFLEANVPGINPVSDDVRRFHVDAYKTWLLNKGRMPSTVARKLSTVACWYKYLLGERFIQFDPTANVKRPKVPAESTREWLTSRELADFLLVAKAEGGYPYALVCVLCENGLRISELLNCDVPDLGKDASHYTLRIMGKGSKPATIALPAPSMEALTLAIGDRTEGPLLLNRRETRLCREGASRIIRRFARQVAPTKNITPHSLRHSGITALVEDGADVIAVQRFARHADLRTTQTYIHARTSLSASQSYVLSNRIAQFQR